MDSFERALQRRRVVGLLGAAASAAIAGSLAACSGASSSGATQGEGGEQDVSAVEDLMREHGVLRRIVIVYGEAARRLATDARSVDAAALGDAAALFRTFGEDYHERQLEERFIFPELKKAGGPGADLVDTLLAQHDRGREVTDYIRQAVGGGAVAGSGAEPLARALSTLERMYHAHTAWEDTVVFPAWKESQTPARLDELAETFEEIEHRQFGKDGFDDAVERIGSIEQRLGVGNLAQFTAPPATGA